MTLEVASQLWAFLSLDIVDLSELPVPEERVGLAAVDALDVHPQSHYDLVVGVGGGLILESHFDSLVRDLHHFEVVLHFLL